MWLVRIQCYASVYKGPWHTSNAGSSACDFWRAAVSNAIVSHNCVLPRHPFQGLLAIASACLSTVLFELINLLSCGQKHFVRV